MGPQRLLARIDAPAALDLLPRMVQHKSNSKSDGEKELAAFMAGRMREIGLEIRALGLRHWTLEEGMMFHKYVSGDGIAISETVPVKKTGCECPTRSPRQLFQV
jgi:hypothetical protein